MIVNNTKFSRLKVVICLKKSKRLNVGLFINNLQNDYSTLVCKGAIVAAQELDINLLIVPGKEINACWNDFDLNQYEYQNNVLYSYITNNNIDVLIMSLGTFAFFLTQEEINKFINSYPGVKIVIMEMIIPGYPCILFGLEGLKEVIEHIIVAHGKKKVAFLSGPENHLVADKRLSVYKEVLAEHNIEYNPDYVAYGDFSEYCVKAVRDLLRRNAGNLPDAICCANDSMVHAISKVFDEQGIKIGKDILVTGYDDAEFASVMDPPLTTVKSYMMTMGHEAVKLAVKYNLDGIPEVRYVKTAMVVRESCSCCSDAVESYDESVINTSIEKDLFISNIENHIFKKSSLDIIPEINLQAVNRFIGYVYDIIVNRRQLESNDLSKKISELLADDCAEYLTITSFNSMFSVIKSLALKNADSGEKVVKIQNAFENAYKILSAYYSNKSLNIEKQLTTDQVAFAKMVDDMMVSSDDEEACYMRLLKNLAKVGLTSCYIYIYQKHMLHKKMSGNNEIWHRPDNIYLKAYLNGTNFIVPSAENQMVGSEYFIGNRYFDTENRKTHILQALYFNEEQYGIMVVEADNSNFLKVPNISRQICTAIKMTRFMNLLELALDDVKKANEVLSRESVSDQLTGLLNRRGFIMQSEKKLAVGKRGTDAGAVIFADLDNLKIINDTFGHNDGDFAIKKAADILKENLRTSDIIGRIGGDEFVALVMGIDKEQIETICSRIKQNAKDFNHNSDKPYNVDISIGMYCFNPENDETIDQLMSKADKILYQNKKFKSRTAIKSQLKDDR